MKNHSFKVTRSFKCFLVMALLSITLVGFFHPSMSMAAEQSSNPSVEVKSTNSTTYFIDDSQFYFTNSNVGNTFRVPRACQARLMTAIVADDKRAENITIEVWNTSGYKETTLTIPTNEAKVTVFNIGGGDHYLKYYGRSGMRYMVRTSLYTWDY